MGDLSDGGMGKVLQRISEKISEVPSWELACSAIRFLDEGFAYKPMLNSPTIHFLYQLHILVAKDKSFRSFHSLFIHIMDIENELPLI